MKRSLSFLNTWLNRLYKALAVLLVLFAVVLSSFRLFLPYAHTYKQEVEDFLNEGYKGQITIGELTAGWQDFGPTLVVKDIVLTNSEVVSVIVDELDIGIDFWACIKHRTLKASTLTLIGANININQSLLLEENEAQVSKANTDIDAISDLLLQQVKRFSVLNSNVRIKTTYQEHNFKIVKLAWLNDKNRHRGIGKIEADGIPENSSKLVVDLYGKNRKELKGKIYTEGNGIDLASWFDKYLGEKGDQIDSNISFKSWITVSEGHFRDLLLDIEESQFYWNSFEQQHQLVIPETRILLSREGVTENFDIQSSPIKFMLNDELWGELSFQMKLEPNDIKLYVSNISLSELWQLYPVIKENFEEIIPYEKLLVGGDLTDLYFRQVDDKRFASATLNDLSWNYANGIPGIKNLNGEFLFAEDKIQLDLNANDSNIDYGESFSRPIPFDQLTATVLVDWDSSYWRLAVKDANLASQELALTANLQYRQEKDIPGQLAIETVVHRGDASKAQYYLPLSIMNDNLVEYLNGAIISGTATQGSVLFHGEPSRFPFEDLSGTFVVDVDIESAKYRFEKSWPAIENLSTNLNFSRNSMLITADGGDLTGIPLTNVAVAIDSFSEGLLTVRTPVAASVDSIKELMLNSPLTDSVGKTIEFINPNGRVTGEFSLDLPLGSGETPVAKGIVNFDNNGINLTAPEMSFTKVNGQLTFNNSYVNTDDITLLWRDMPLDVAVEADQKGELYQVDIHLDGDWEKDSYQAQIPEALKQYVEGELNWQGKVSLFFSKDGNMNYEVDANSNLQATTLSLPVPYRKESGISLPLTVNVKGHSSGSIINAAIGEQLHFFGDLNHQTNSFTRSNLVLGKESMLLPMEGFHITVGLEDIVFEPWSKFITDLVSTLPKRTEEQITTDQVAKTSLISVPERIRGSINNVDLYGQDINDVSFNLLSESQWWLLQLNSDQIRSRFKFYHDFAADGVEVDADFIHLSVDLTEPEEDVTVISEQEYTVVEGETEQQLINDLFPHEIPKIVFHSESVIVKDLDLGGVDFQVVKTASDKVELQNFVAKRKGAEITMQGDWQRNETINQSHFDGKFSVKNVSKEVEAFGFSSGLKDTGLKSNFLLEWQGAPHEFNFETLNGQYKAKFDDGYLADVSDKGARILSLFSLQSLVRKLSLDFRDVFSKGMFFNDIKSDFDIKDGIVYTDNSVVDASAGILKIKGNTSLISNELDYKMSFAPKVTSSLPVIIGWLVNPLMGVAILAADEVIQKAEVISVINFELTGTLDEPIFKEVDRKSRDITVGKSKPDKVIDSKSKIQPELDDPDPETGPVKKLGAAIVEIMPNSFNESRMELVQSEDIESVIDDSDIRLEADSDQSNTGEYNADKFVTDSETKP